MDNLISFVILLSFSIMVASDGPKVCSVEDESRLYPCGESSDNTIITDSGVKLKEITLVDQSCLVQSVASQLDPRSWDDARQFCLDQGWDLVELLRYDVSYYLMGHISGNIWVGGYRVEPDGGFNWSRSQAAVRNSQVLPWANLQHRSPSGGGRLCVSYRPPTGRADIDCETKLHWICEGLETDYYKSNLTAIPRNTWRYKVGEKVRLVCSYRSRRAGRLIISGQGPDYEVNNNRLDNASAGTYQIYHQETEGPNYIYDGARCFATYSISVWLNANMKLNNARVRCCPKLYMCTDNKLLIQQEPIKPIVAVDSNPNKNTVLFYSVVIYTCIARLALGTIMTFSVTCSNKLWTTAYYMDGTMDESGELCIDKDVISVTTEQGNDIWWGGNHMNFTLKFRALESTEGIQMSCSSSDVRYKAGNTTELAEDPLTDLRTLTLTYGNITRPTLLADFPPVDSDGEFPVYGCDTVKASCFAVIGHGGQLVFVVILPSGNGSWSSNDRESSTLPQWVAITEVDESSTEDHVPTVKIYIDIYVTEETAKAGYECITHIGTRMLRRWIRNKFTYKVSSLPPRLEASNYTTDDGLLVVSLNCTTNVGTGSTQTWGLLDYNGEQYNWFVSTHKAVQGLSHLPLWLGISVVTDKEDSGCGMILTTNVTVRLRRHHLGLTFTCYSVDIFHKFTSKYTFLDLAASYQVMDEGVRRVVDNNTLAGSDLFQIIVGICGCCVLVAAICTLVKKDSSDNKVVSEVSSQSVTLLDSSFDHSTEVFVNDLNVSPSVVKDAVESTPVDIKSFRGSSRTSRLSTSVFDIEPSAHKTIGHPTGHPSGNHSGYPAGNPTVTPTVNPTGHPEDPSTVK